MTNKRTTKISVQSLERHFAPGYDVPPHVDYRHQRFTFASAKMSRLIKGGVCAQFVKG